MPTERVLNDVPDENKEEVIASFESEDCTVTTERQPDGKYVGVITVYQRFEGISEDGLTYKDTTKKDITIYVEKKKTQIRGRIIEFWDVLLGDIRVTETTS